MSEVFKTIGVLTVLITVSVVLVGAILIPADAGWYLLDRVDWESGRDTIVLRQDRRAKPIWICASGTAVAPRNCLSREQLLQLAHEQWQTPLAAREGKQAR